MMGYDKTLITLDVFYDECMDFWLGTGQGGRAADFLAMTDVMALERDPFSPNGELLDPKAKEDFIKLYSHGQEVAISYDEL